MRHPIQMQIIDPKSVLSDVDQHQVENMIWLRLSPIKESVEMVKFEVNRLDQGEFGREHLVTTSTKLTTGHVVTSYTTRVSKGAALVASTNHMKDCVERRIRFEKSWLYQSARWANNAASSILQSVRALLRLPEHKRSSPAS